MEAGSVNVNSQLVQDAFLPEAKFRIVQRSYINVGNIKKEMLNLLNYVWDVLLHVRY